MEVLFFMLFIFLIVIPLVLMTTIPIYKGHRKATGGIINYDSFMRKFVYKIYLSNQKIIDLLNTKNDLDELSCTFDFDKSIVRIAEYGSHRDYYFQIQECDGFSILRLEEVTLIGMKSTVPYKLNPFMIHKLQAEMIQFSESGF